MKIGASCVCKVGQELMFFADTMNIIFFVNLNDGRVRFMPGIPEEEFVSSYLVSDIIYSGGDFFFIPGNAKKMWKCDANFDNWKAISIEYPNIVQKFHSAQLWEEKIYIFQHNFPYSIVYNINTGEISNLEIGKNLIITDSCIVNKNIYCTVACECFIIKYDLKGNVKKIYTEEKMGFNAIYVKENKVIMAPRNGNKLYLLVDDFLKKIEIPKIDARGIISYFDEIIVTSCTKYESIKIKKNKFYEYNCLNEKTKKIKNGSYLISKMLDSGESVIIDSSCNLKIFDSQGKKVYDNEIVLSLEKCKKFQIYYKYNINKIFALENNNLNLNDYIMLIKG